MSLVVWGVEFKIERWCVSASSETRWGDVGLVSAGGCEVTGGSCLAG